MEMNKSQIKVIDAFPKKVDYSYSDNVTIIIEVMNASENNMGCKLTIGVSTLHNVLINDKIDIRLTSGLNTITYETKIETSTHQSFGVDISLGHEVFSTAFDLLDHWSERPRYGFLSDFYKEDEEDLDDVYMMAKYHINVVQFYDWMYKHEDLIPKDDYFIDLLERKLSKKAVENKVEGCHSLGMKALAYGAIYAASREFYENHKEWALYTNDNQPQNLGNWFYIMNISKESPWFEHIIKQFALAVEVINFDGIHMDTYGFPKTAYSNLNGNKKIERLNEQFEDLIVGTKDNLKRHKEDIGLIFNAVSNWAVEDLAVSPIEAVYIEVWDPQDKYYHLYQLINRGRELGKKQVILAAYLKCFALKEQYTYEQCKISFLLCSAVIYASGGFHLILGEKNGLLADSYYVNYEEIEPSFEREVRNYYDFIVRYGDLLFSLDNIDNSMTYANGDNLEVLFINGVFSSYPQPNMIWTVVKEQPGYKIIQLVNFTGIHSDVWNEGKEKRPDQVSDIEVRALVDEKVLGVFLASPDFEQGRPKQLDYTVEKMDRGNSIRFKIPVLDIWDLIYIEVDEEM